MPPKDKETKDKENKDKEAKSKESKGKDKDIESKTKGKDSKNKDKGSDDGKNKSKKDSQDPEDSPKEEVPPPPPNHVYVYLQLQKIESLPKYCEGPDREFIIELSHITGNVQKLKEPYDLRNTRLHWKEKCRCSLGDYKLTFTVRVEQDSFNEMNIYSDCPIIVTIYQWTPRHPKDMDGDMPDDYFGEFEYEPEMEDARLEPIAMGQIDLFSYFSKRRALANLTHFVYPISDRRLSSIKMTWHIYTLLPLLKEHNFNNIIFLQLESLYNTHTDLLDDCEDLLMDFSLRKKRKSGSEEDELEDEDENGEMKSLKICTFGNFYKEIIDDQDSNYVWASMRQYEPVTTNRLCEQCGLRLNKYHIFHNVLGTEYVDFKIDLIDSKKESALVCNAAHRFVLNAELSKLLEEAIACSDQELVLELYRESLPEVVLLAGTVNLAILAYPHVNTLRFVIELVPAHYERKIVNLEQDDDGKDKNKDNAKDKDKAKEKDKDKSKDKDKDKSKEKDKDKDKSKEKDKDKDKSKDKDKEKSKDKDKDKSKDKSKDKDITKEKSKDQDKSKDKSTKKKEISTTDDESFVDFEGIGEMEEEEWRPTFATMTICILYPFAEGNEDLPSYNDNENKQDCLRTCRRSIAEVPKDPKYCEECYRNFDHVVLGVINDILLNDIIDIEKCPGFYCCHLSNMTNRLTKIIACDFNIRFPTKTSIQFTNLLTTVYAEMEDRIFKILNKCSKNGIEHCILNMEEDMARQIRYFNLYKFSMECGETTFAEFMFEKLKETCSFDYIINFFKFLYDVETEDFFVAEEYLSRPLNEQDISSGYYSDIIEIYINHKKNAMTEETSELAFELLLEALISFTSRYPKDIDMWIVLYCYYNRAEYIPGTEYCRWKFENLYNEPQRKLAFVPIPRWDMYYHMEDEREWDSIRGEYFYKTLLVLLRIGAYEFAEMVFNEILDEFDDFEIYCIETTLQIVQTADMVDFIPDDFDHDGADAENLKAIENHINGHVDYYNDNVDEALSKYGKILDLAVEEYEPFQLGLLRYGYENLRRGNYSAAFAAFDKCCVTDENRLFAYMGKGKAMYSVGNLAKAEYWFAECTRFELYNQDVWAWLALINLRQGDNFKALQCWKHARLSKNNVIDPEILDELDKIDIMDVSLYIDLPKCRIGEKVDDILKSICLKT